MGNVTWIGTDGDWNDPSNWSTESVPSLDDVVEFLAADPATVEGAAFVGSILLDNADLTLSGNFASDGLSTASIVDETGSNGTLTIDPWASGVLDKLALKTSFLDTLGSLLTNEASIASGVIDGSAAQWVSANATITDSLTVQNGGSLYGNFSLGDGATLSVDSTSSFSDGTITASGNATIDFLRLGVQGSYTEHVTDSLFVSAGSTLTLKSSIGATICLEGSQIGPGYVGVTNANLIFSSGAGSRVPINSKSTSSSQTNLGYLVVGSEIDFRNQNPDGNTENIVQAKGATDTILGGSLSLFINADVSSLLDVVASSGQTTVFGSSGALSVTGGTGDLFVYDVNSADFLVGGSANNTLIGGAGSIIHASGAGTNVIGTNSSSALLDASATSGYTSLFSGVGTGTATLIGGSGSDVFVAAGAAVDVVCGTGNDSVWASAASVGTVVGGSGDNIIQGPASAVITVSGAGSDVVVTGIGTTQIDGSRQSGRLITFANHSTECSLIAGSGTVLAVVGSTDFNLAGASQGSLVWCLDKANVSLTGESNASVVIAGSEDTINASSSSGTNVITVGLSSNSLLRLNDGSNEVVCGSSDATVQLSGGKSTIFGGSGHLHLDFASPGQSASSAIVLGFDPTSDTLNFGALQTNETTTSYGVEITYGSSTILLWDYSGSAPISH